MTILSLLGSDYQPSSQQSVTDKVCVPITSQTYKLVLPPELPEVTCVLLGCLASSHQAPGAGCMVQFYVVQCVLLICPRGRCVQNPIVLV